jgi:CarD family transcriptional regulator
MYVLPASRRSQKIGREAVMELKIGQKVAYPNQGVCLIEEVRQQTFGGNVVSGYCLRVLGDNSTIFVPKDNAESVGLRPLISSAQCKKLIDTLSDDFEPVSADWKTRSRQFTEKLRSGDVFQAADVLKMLVFLSHEKRLSFREQSLLEKAKFLILSEIKNTFPSQEIPMESEIISKVEAACYKHNSSQQPMAAVSH